MFCDLKSHQQVIFESVFPMGKVAKGSEGRRESGSDGRARGEGKGERRERGERRGERGSEGRERGRGAGALLPRWIASTSLFDRPPCPFDRTGPSVRSHRHLSSIAPLARSIANTSLFDRPPCPFDRKRLSVRSPPLPVRSPTPLCSIAPHCPFDRKRLSVRSPGPPPSFDRTPFSVRSHTPARSIGAICRKFPGDRADRADSRSRSRGWGSAIDQRPVPFDRAPSSARSRLSIRRVVHLY
jgi:hypothetical protein